MPYVNLLGRWYKSLIYLVPRGGIEPPTLRFSVPGKGWLSNSRKIRKWLYYAIFWVLMVPRSSRKFLNISGTFAHDYTGTSRPPDHRSRAPLATCTPTVIPPGVVGRQTRAGKRSTSPPTRGGRASLSPRHPSQAIAPTGDRVACPHSRASRATASTVASASGATRLLAERREE